MEAWVLWIIGAIWSLIMGALAFFIKRNISQNDERQKTIEAETIKRQEKMEANLTGQIKDLRLATEARSNKNEQAIEKLESRFNDFVKEIPRDYVGKEAWMIQNQRIDGKLDKITDILIGIGRREGNG
jgi:uncharacterized membrane-anchored protein YhcB (DUF1043 family)